MKEDLVKVNIKDVILDENNQDPIYLTNSDGNEVGFEQIATIFLKDELYCILKPLDKMDGIGENDALVFKIIDDEDEPYLQLEDNEMKAIEVFNEYYELLEESKDIKGE